MDRLKESRKVYEKLFNSLPDESKEKDPELMEILHRFIFGDVFASSDEIDMQMRELVTITVLATMQTLPQLKSHTQAGLNVGLKPEKIREAIYQLAPFVGFPKTLNAIGVVDEVFEQNGIKLPLQNAGTVTDKTRFKKGLEIQYPIYGDEIKDKYPEVPALPKYLTEFCFGDFYTREGLNTQERELLVLVVLTTIRSDTQIKAHLIGNLKVGNSKEKIIATMLQCLPYVGFPAVMNTINMLKNVED